MDGVVDLERIARVVQSESPDLVLLQEVDQGCARSGGVDQAQVLAARLGMTPHFCAFRPYDGGLYGMAALSRLPVLSAECVSLPPGPNPLSFLELRVELDGEPLLVGGLHLVTTEAQRLAQAEFLIARYGDAAQPVLLAGDLNSERDDPVVARLQTVFDVPEKPGAQLTFPADHPVKEIDFVLLAPKHTWTVTENRVIDEPLASDHRPVLLEARLSAH